MSVHQVLDRGSLERAAKTAAQVRDEALSSNVAYALVEELTTRFGARLAGTRSEHEAAEWGAKRLRSLGFENVTIEEFPLTLWERGREEAEIVAPSRQRLVVSALGGSPPTSSDGLEAVAEFFPTYQDLLDSPEGLLDGKIAVVLESLPRTQDLRGYLATAQARIDGPQEAAKRGAAAYLVRSLGTHNRRMAHAGATSYYDGAIPSFSLAPPDAEQLWRIARTGEVVRLKLTSTGCVQPDMSHSQNVVAEVPGRERPEEVIVVGGHLDSWDLGTGALDDGAGIAIVTAAAKLIADQPVRPKRTIRVVWFGSEEVLQPSQTQSFDGISGSLMGGNCYVSNRANDLHNHVVTSESDLGAGPVYALGLPEGLENTEFRRTAERLLRRLNIVFDPRPVTTGGPDVSPLNKAGVPAFSLYQDVTNYFDVHHTADDTIERIIPADLNQNVAAWAAMLWLVADTNIDFRCSG